MKSYQKRFSTIVYTSVKAVALMLLPVFFLSCDDKKDEEAPKVIIQLPYENQTFSTVDTIPVVAQITDNQQITSVAVSLLDESFGALGVERRYQTSGSSVNFGVDFGIDEPFLLSGTYYIAVRGNDGENIGSGFVKIQLTAIEQVIENYIVVTNNATRAQVLIGETFSDIIQKTEFTMDLRGAAFNYRQNILGLASGVIGDANFYEIDEFVALQSIPGYGTPSIPYFLGLDYSVSTERFLLMQREPQIRVLNKHAVPISSFELAPSFLPEHTFTVSDDIFVEQKSITSPNRILARFASSGHLLSTYTASGEVREVSRKSDQEAFVWVDGEEGTKLLILNYTNNLLAEAYSRPNESLYAAKEIEKGVFLISTSTGLYRYAYAAGGTSILNQSVMPTSLYYDGLNGFIYGSEDNVLYQLSATGQLLNTRSFPDKIAYFAIDYNR